MYFEELRRRIVEAGQRIGFVDRHYRIGERQVRLRFAGPSLVPALTRALAHLGVPSGPDPDLTVYLAAADAVSRPAPPWEILRQETPDDQDASPMAHVRDERVDGLFELDGSSLRMLDRAAGVGVFWTPSPARVPRYETAAPLRSILDWWSRERGWRVLHAGAVGTERGGALLVGKAGSGKSTAALACLGSGLAYAGDDGVLVGGDAGPRVQSLYCTAKLEPGHLRRALPQLEPLLAESEASHRGKRQVFLDRHCPAELSSGFPLRAVLLPRVTGAPRAVTRRVSAATGLLALAPSTLLQLPGDRGERLSHMARVLRRVPVHVLELGTDLGTVAPAIHAVLDDATR
jgi:hypothetical protein